jgi:hypothetical protein
MNTMSGTYFQSLVNLNVAIHAACADNGATASVTRIGAQSSSPRPKAPIGKAARRRRIS